MYKIAFGKSGMEVPTVAVGCMRIGGMTDSEVSGFIESALECGGNFFDHADIYCGGKSEAVFGRALTPDLREKLIIQTKCGIVPGTMYDFSYEHIIEAVEGSLTRLGTDYIDVLLLHRPDALMEPEEVARAFDHLKNAGKVKHFGVSNQNRYQVELLSSYLDMPICANQLQFSIMHTSMVSSGINVNLYNDSATVRDGGILDYCRLNGITIQPWSPMQNGFFEGCFIDNEKFPEVNRAMDEVAEKYGISKTTLAIAWILRHPARMQPITGTTNPERLRDCLKASEVTLTREDWYKIYTAAGNELP
ncbi:MAG: aldo/keto reductase [Clostridia bacterium]|nr:aldo/keto reductase [Clostridia bacterium]